MDEFNLYDDLYDTEYKEDKSIHCRHCQWEGLMKETKQNFVNSSEEAWHSLAGRKGYEYACPKCGWIVAHHWIIIS